MAVEHQLDARAFLKQVCLKAGLPPDAWKQDDTTLMTFEGYAIRGRLDASAGAAAAWTDGWAGGPTRDELAALARFCRSNLMALLQGATPWFYLAGGYDGGIHGVAMTVGPPGSTGRSSAASSRLRLEIPLQATLFKLCEAAARTLAARRIERAIAALGPAGAGRAARPGHARHRRSAAVAGRRSDAPGRAGDRRVPLGVGLRSGEDAGRTPGRGVAPGQFFRPGRGPTCSAWPPRRPSRG